MKGWINGMIIANFIWGDLQNMVQVIAAIADAGPLRPGKERSIQAKLPWVKSASEAFCFPTLVGLPDGFDATSKPSW